MWLAAAARLTVWRCVQEIPNAWVPKELSKYMSSTVGGVYEEASKYMTYMKMGKEAATLIQSYSIPPSLP